MLQAFLAHLRDRNFNISGEMKTGRGGFSVIRFLQGMEMCLASRQGKGQRIQKLQDTHLD